MLEDQIRRLREAVGASSDSDLGVRLGLTRFAVSRWKSRGVIPVKYRYLVDRGGLSPIDAGVQQIANEHIYSHADNHYWLRAALHLLPSNYAASLQGMARALLLEFVVTRLMSAAADATVRELGKARCEGEPDYAKLLAILNTTYADRVRRVLDDGRPLESPNSPHFNPKAPERAG